MGPYFPRKYATGTGADIYIPIVKRGVVDFAVGADWTPAAGDVKVSIDGGAAANITTLPTAVTMGSTAMWKFVFSNGELTGKAIIVTVADASTKAVEDSLFGIHTFGHASAWTPRDLSVTEWASIGSEADGVETSYTVKQVLRGLFAVAQGVASGLDTGSPVFKAPDGTTTRISGTGADAAGNRPSVTRNL